MPSSLSHPLAQPAPRRCARNGLGWEAWIPTWCTASLPSWSSRCCSLWAASGWTAHVRRTYSNHKRPRRRRPTSVWQQNARRRGPRRPNRPKPSGARPNRRRTRLRRRLKRPLKKSKRSRRPASSRNRCLRSRSRKARRAVCSACANACRSRATPSARRCSTFWRRTTCRKPTGRMWKTRCCSPMWAPRPPNSLWSNCAPTRA